MIADTSGYFFSYSAGEIDGGEHVNPYLTEHFNIFSIIRTMSDDPNVIGTAL